MWCNNWLQLVLSPGGYLLWSPSGIDPACIGLSCLGVVLECTYNHCCIISASCIHNKLESGTQQQQQQQLSPPTQPIRIQPAPLGTPVLLSIQTL